MLASEVLQADAVEARCRQGLNHAAAGRHDDAAASYLAAWTLLPEPREERSEARWILSAVVGAALARGCHEQALELHRAVREAAGEANARLRVALAEVGLELGQPELAREELALAVERAGPGVLLQGGAACRSLLGEGTVPP